MKCQYLWALPVLALFTLASCSNDDTAQENNGKQKGTPAGMTEFAVKEATTRTMGVYSGLGIDFYWTQDDKLWINNTSSLVQSSDDDITGKAATAKFYFTGTYNASSYPVRYTGKGSNAGDKVTIKAEQKQATPNDGSHIGTDGDCGTATATRGADGKYGFTLSHKASYITFMPYYSYEFAEDVKVTQIKVTADEVLAGEFKFDDNGLDLASRTTVVNPGKSITLELNGGTNNGFTIPISPDYTKNAAIMVLAPGTYHNFTVEYRLYDQKTLVYGTVSKNYGQLTFHAGQNKKVVADLQVPNYSKDRFYMWDAAVGQNAWKNYENYQPILNEGVDSHYPTVSTDARWYNPALIPAKASRSAKDCPNANEMLWYCMYGDPHWDEELWTAMGHIQSGGMWIKKKANISGFRSDLAADNKTDMRTTNKSFRNDEIPDDYGEHLFLSEKPNYFYLPAFGQYDKDFFHYISKGGYYWTSSACPWGGETAYSLRFGRGAIEVEGGSRAYGNLAIPFE